MTDMNTFFATIKKGSPRAEAFGRMIAADVPMEAIVAACSSISNEATATDPSAGATAETAPSRETRLAELKHAASSVNVGKGYSRGV